MKVVKINDIIDYCEAQISHLYARHETIALAQLRGVKEFCKDSAVDMPAADVQPVKRGHWEEREGYGGWGDTYYHCSVCGSDWVFEDGTPEANEWDYCPKCGARMDGDCNLIAT